MKALVTGVRRIHRLARSASVCSTDGAEVVGIDCFTDYYARALKERNLSGAVEAPALPIRRGADPGRRSAGAARRRDPRVPPRGAGRRAQELGPRLRDLHREQHRSDAAAAGGVRRSARLERLVYASSSSVYGDAWRSRCARTRCRSRCRRTASPSWRPSSSAISTSRQLRRADRLAAVLHRLRTAAAAGHGVPQVHPRRDSTASRSRVYGDGEQTRDFTFVADAVDANVAAGDPWGAGPRVQYWRRLARLRQARARR